MKIIFVRHGETIENVEGIIQGQSPGRLTAKGWLQVYKVAERLKEENIDVIYTSDSARALNTAKEIAKFHSVPLISTEKLRERGKGKLEGMFKKDLGEDYYSHPEVETIESLMKRTKEFLEEIRSENILIVSHGQCMAALYSNLSGKSYPEVEKNKKMDNTGISIFEKKLILHNCTKHLEKK